jgi:hypothetical protein
VVDGAPCVRCAREHLLGLRGKALVEEPLEYLAQTQVNRIFDAEFVKEIVEHRIPEAGVRAQPDAGVREDLAQSLQHRPQEGHRVRARPGAAGRQVRTESVPT